MDVVVQYAKGLGGTEVRVLDLYGLLEEIVATPASFAASPGAESTAYAKI